MTTLAFLLEEPSAREMLKGIVPKLVPQHVMVRHVCFEGKQDLHKQLVRKLRGWLAPDTHFVVMRDQDAGDCKAVKESLHALCRKAGRNAALIRIACRELESFYLGDLAAVERGLGVRALAAQQDKRKYSQPDTLDKPSHELIELSRRRYQKLSGSRAIAPHLRLDAGNRSHSFNVLVNGIRQFADERLHVNGKLHRESKHES